MNAPPYLFQQEPVAGRIAFDGLQEAEPYRPEIDVVYLRIPGPGSGVSLRILLSGEIAGPLPVILYIHGGGWVFGSRRTHDRLVRELADRTGAAVVFVQYRLAPEARYPMALEECYATLEWVAGRGAEENLDGGRVVVIGDGTGGNIAAALTLMVNQRGGPDLAGQVLLSPATDAGCDTPSFHEFAEAYHLRADAMKWFWEQYLPDRSQRSQVTASPLRATAEQLVGLPPALVITAEADVLRDEGEAYAAQLRQEGVPVTAIRYEGMIHDFVVLNALRRTAAAEAAITQAATFITIRLDSQ